MGDHPYDGATDSIDRLAGRVNFGRITYVCFFGLHILSPGQCPFERPRPRGGPCLVFTYVRKLFPWIENFKFVILRKIFDVFSY